MRNSEEFVQWIRANEGIIYKITRAYESHPENQKDLYQEIVYQLWKAYPKFRREAKVSTWIYRIALNTSLTYKKQSQKRRAKTLQEFELPEIGEESDPFQKDRLQQLYQSIQQLTLVEKGLILLYLEGKSYAEMGEIMGFTPTNVGTRLARIRKKLSNLVKQK
ncbi:MAG: sigma-70 family RNA polymerase sigma factor [Bacteroidota bacterium]